MTYATWSKGRDLLSQMNDVDDRIEHIAKLRGEANAFPYDEHGKITIRLGERNATESAKVRLYTFLDYLKRELEHEEGIRAVLAKEFDEL